MDEAEILDIHTGKSRDWTGQCETELTFKSNFNIDLSTNVNGEASGERAADACTALASHETLLLGPWQQ